MGLERLPSSTQAKHGGEEEDVDAADISDKYVIKPDRKQKSAHEKSDAAKYEEEHAPSFQIEDISGKGTGLVALKKLYPGDLIMVEKPLIVVAEDIYDDLEKVDKYLDKAVNRLSCPDRELFLNLTDCRTPNNPTYLGIFDTNDMNFAGNAAVFPQMARANHACLPNAEFVSDYVNKIQKLVAIDIIDNGEEITISYLPMEEEGTDKMEERQKFLMKWYGFTCTCSACSREKGDLLDDDKLREATKELQAAGLENLSIEELKSLILNLFSISSKQEYLLRVVDALYRKTSSVPDQLYSLYTAVQGLCLACSLYGWTDVQTDMWRDRAVCICGQM